MSLSSHLSTPEHPNAIAPQNRSPFKFILLVFAISIPLVWLIGLATSLQFLPGLPASSLMVIVPVTAALILAYSENRTVGMAELLKRSFDYRRIRAKIWYAPIFLLMPAVMVLSYVLLLWTGTPVPPPQFSILTAGAMFFAFLIAALGEEIGWTGYATDPLQNRYGALPASILLGLVWAAWHLIPLAQVGRSREWMAWWCLATVAQRVLIVWLYNNTGKSVLAAVVFHAMSNLSWQMFPINGSYYDPRITGLIVAFVAVVVTIVYGPRRLMRPSDV